MLRIASSVAELAGFLLLAYGILRESFEWFAKERAYGEGRYGEGAYGGALGPVARRAADLGVWLRLLPTDRTLTQADHVRNAAFAVAGVLVTVAAMLVVLFAAETNSQQGLTTEAFTSSRVRFDARWLDTMSWLLNNGLGIATVVGAGAATAAAVIGWRQLRFSRRDVHLIVGFRDENDGLASRIAFKQSGDSIAPVSVRFEVVNIGGSECKGAALTITLPPELEAFSSKDWSVGVPNALMPGNSSASTCKLPPIGRNGRHITPALKLKVVRRDLPSDSFRFRAKLRWETFVGAGRQL